MDGVATPAGSCCPIRMVGARKNTHAGPGRTRRGKKLLKEAGYPNGFTITLGAPNGRYINDLKIAQTVAAMWSRSA